MSFTNYLNLIYVIFFESEDDYLDSAIRDKKEY